MVRKDDPACAEFEQQRKKDWLGLVTPILVTIMLFMLQGLNGEIGGIKGDLKETNMMVFKHLTNDELHCPRSVTVTKPEFLIYQNMRDKQMDDIRASNIRIEGLLEKHMDKVTGK